MNTNTTSQYWNWNTFELCNDVLKYLRYYQLFRRFYLNGTSCLVYTFHRCCKQHDRCSSYKVQNDGCPIFNFSNGTHRHTRQRAYVRIIKRYRWKSKQELARYLGSIRLHRRFTLRLTHSLLCSICHDNAKMLLIGQLSPVIIDHQGRLIYEELYNARSPNVW